MFVKHESLQKTGFINIEENRNRFLIVSSIFFFFLGFVNLVYCSSVFDYEILFGRRNCSSQIPRVRGMLPSVLFG